METKIYFDKWSEKLSVPVEEIQSEFDNLLIEEKEIHKDLDDEGQQKRALQRLALYSTLKHLLQLVPAC